MLLNRFRVPRIPCHFHPPQGAGSDDPLASSMMFL